MAQRGTRQEPPAPRPAPAQGSQRCTAADQLVAASGPAPGPAAAPPSRRAATCGLRRQAAAAVAAAAGAPLPLPRPVVPAAGCRLAAPAPAAARRFELRKNVPCTLALQNPTGERVAFKVKTTSPKKYCVRPSSGIVEPGSSKEVQVIMQAQREYPPSLAGAPPAAAGGLLPLGARRRGAGGQLARALGAMP